MELADSTDPIRYSSRLFYKDSQPSGALALATSQPSGPASARSSQFLAACPSGQEEVVRQTAVEDYLETQLSSALLLRSADEARAWTLAYARHIIVTGEIFKATSKKNVTALGCDFNKKNYNFFT